MQEMPIFIDGKKYTLRCDEDMANLFGKDSTSLGLFDEKGELFKWYDPPIVKKRKIVELTLWQKIKKFLNL